MKNLIICMAVLLIMPGISMACSPVAGAKPPTVQDTADAMMHSTALAGFVGKVELVSKKPLDDNGSAELEFKVLKQYRGEKVDTIKVTTHFTTCGVYQIEVGQVDIISPSKDDKGWQIWAGPNDTGIDAEETAKLEEELDKIVAEDAKKPEAAE